MKFKSLGLYTAGRIISKETFMSLYTRCTYKDLGDLLYMLYDDNLMVDGSGNVTPIVRLSPLLRSDTPCLRVRSDATPGNIHSSKFGFGYVVSDSEGSIVLRDTSVANGDFGTLTKGERTLKAEFHALTVALERTVSLSGCTNVRIQLDSSTVVELLEGKVTKYSAETMNMVCRIGQHLKFFGEYSISHIYRELNRDCDYLASLSGADIVDEKFNALNKDIPRFRHCVKLTSLPEAPRHPSYQVIRFFF